jgi:predicted nucleotidyltransferase
MILFWGRARGTSRPDSDVDFLLMKTGTETMRSWETRADAPNHVIAWAFLEGRELSNA